ncbi:MAG TPA: aminoacetone oxidase family FAD-binding enzyme, partial [Casimicrobiaceae bacterium]
MLDYDVVVIGAGAAGMMCAAQAGQRGRRVLVIEHYHLLGEKIRISGGGRCNFTNTGAGPGNYLSQNPDFCRSALARYTPRHFISLVEKYGIAYHEKKLGQLFCDDTAQDIIRMLKSECERGNVQWRMPCPVDGVERTAEGFAIATPQGPVRCASLVIATGGLSVPKIGATPFGYRIAEQFGLP